MLLRIFSTMFNVLRMTLWQLQTACLCILFDCLFVSSSSFIGIMFHVFLVPYYFLIQSAISRILLPNLSICLLYDATLNNGHWAPRQSKMTSVTYNKTATCKILKLFSHTENLLREATHSHSDNSFTGCSCIFYKVFVKGKIQSAPQWNIIPVHKHSFTTLIY